MMDFCVPIREVQGTPLPEFLKGEVIPEKIARVIRFAATSVEQISAGGLSLTCCKVSDVLVTEVELIFNSDFIQGKPETAASAAPFVFSSFRSTQQCRSQQLV